MRVSGRCASKKAAVISASFLQNNIYTSAQWNGLLKHCLKGKSIAILAVKEEELFFLTASWEPTIENQLSRENVVKNQKLG